MENEVANGSVAADEGNEKRNRGKGLYAVLGILYVAIVGLVVGIVVVSAGGGSGENDTAGQSEQHAEDASAIAGGIYDGIKTKMESDPNYDLAKAEQEFESEIAKSDSRTKAYIAIWYANFIYEETKDAARAIDILKDVEQSVDDQSRVDYYVALRYFYDVANDEKNAEYYNALIEELVPDVVEGNIEMSEGV